MGRMKFGVTIFLTEDTLQPAELARAVEARGFESLWLPEHSHIPISRQTPWGGVPGADPLPERYWRTYDTFVSLAVAAAVTSTLKLATGITLLAQRDPVWTAKEVATLDQVSGGRVIFGVGYGWNKEEMATHGVDYLQRRAILREHLLLMKSLWTDEVARFEGEHVNLPPSWAWPKPIQRPHPPVILGAGAGPRTISDLVELCDGWIPLGRHALNTEDVTAGLTQAGRDPAAFDFTYFAAKPNRSSIDHLAERGMGRAVFTLPTAEPAEVMRHLDECARFVEEYVG